jgi:hypothetical protein
MSVYDDGYNAAFKNGKRLSDNPHAKGTSKWHAWRQGCLAGQTAKTSYKGAGR